LRSVILHRINGKITEEGNEENAGADFLAIVFLHHLNGGRRAREHEIICETAPRAGISL